MGYPLGHVFAQLQPYAPEGSAPQFSSIEEIMGSIESVVWYVFGTIVIVCFVMAGILFLTAQGDPEKLKTARHAFMWGVAGVVVGLIAYSIIAIVTGFMTGSFGGGGGNGWSIWGQGNGWSIQGGGSF